MRIRRSEQQQSDCGWFTIFNENGYNEARARATKLLAVHLHSGRRLCASVCVCVCLHALGQYNENVNTIYHCHMLAHVSFLEDIVVSAVGSAGVECIIAHYIHINIYSKANYLISLCASASDWCLFFLWLVVAFAGCVTD